MLENIAEKIADLQSKNPFMFILVFILITLMLVPGIFNLVGNVEPSLEKVLPQKIEEVKTMNYMREQFGADMMYLIVYPDGPINDVRNPQFLKYMDVLSQKISSNEYILKVSSLSDLVKETNVGIPDSYTQIKDILSKHPFTSRYSNSVYSMAIIEIKSDTGSSAELINQVVNNINNDIDNLESINPGAKVEITGFNAIDKATFEIIMSDFASITMFSMAVVAFIVFLTFGSLGRGMLPMVVVMTSLVWTMGVVGYLNLTITVVSMVAAAMIMGLGIDFGIHQVHTYFEKRKKHNSKSALKETLKELLRAMIGASLTTSAGFLALLFGVLPAMKILGIILALGIIFTLIGAIFLLPVVIYLYDGGNKNVNQ